MQQKNEYHSFVGMQTDLILSKHPANLLRDAKNIRITQREGDTLLAITNERGPEDMHTQVKGTYLGHCLLNEYLIVFHKSTLGDFITRITLEPELTIISGETVLQCPKTLLFKGNLNFNKDYKIEAIASYENENIQKVYWTDGLNQPRVINILSEPYDGQISDSVYTGYDFVRKLKLDETITVEKMLGASGMFPAGVIQYAFTYYMKHGQETAVFYTSPLIYTSYRERGGSPEDTVENAFKIIVRDVDYENFDYLRIYSIMRTSLNGTPICKRVQDIELKNLSYTEDNANVKHYYISFTDTGHEGDAVDPTELLYKGGQTITAGTIEQKDGTMFLGDLLLTRESLRQMRYEVGESLPATGTIRPPHPRTAYNGSQGPLHWVEVIDDYGISIGAGSGIGGGSDDTYTPAVIDTPVEEPDFTDALNPPSVNDYPPITNFDGTYDGQTLEYIVHDTTSIFSDTRTFKSPKVFEGSYEYSNQLTSYSNISYYGDSLKNYVPCSGFKKGDYYRLGVQFQHESGAWSDPVFIADTRCVGTPSISGEDITVPTFKGRIREEVANTLLDFGYKRVRAVVVYPEMQDRVVMCQGVVNPTVIKSGSTSGKFYQSSWFFRPNMHNSLNALSNGCVIPCDTGICYTSYFIDTVSGTGGHTMYDPTPIKRVEIQGEFDDDNKFVLSKEVLSLHSPDIAFNDDYQLMDFSQSKYRKVGKVSFKKTLSDIEIQTETPTISSMGGGFQHKSFTRNFAYGIGAGLFYDDCLVDEWDDGTYHYWKSINSTVKFMVYPWNRTGSLNNDVNRPSDKGVRTANLKKKIISNLRYADTIYNFTNTLYKYNSGFHPQVFSENGYEMLKLLGGDGSDSTQNGDFFYRGFVDTLLSPDKNEGLYFAFSGSDIESDAQNTDFDASVNWKTFAGDYVTTDDDTTVTVHGMQGLWEYAADGTDPVAWHKRVQNVANKDAGLGYNKEGVRMKYKSSSHLVFDNRSGSSTTVDLDTADSTNPTVLSIVEFINGGSLDKRSTMFGGTSEDAFKANTWLPCGEPVSLEAVEYDDFTVTVNEVDTTVNVGYVPFLYSYGDTYYQRWDCLKTYAYTQEDINQVVEIGSFMLETHVNIDGRYDRNRGQINNLYMSPINFNLLNPVYSQKNNFFQYKILDSSYYKNDSFPNQITWTKEKHAGADTDLWTNITLASTLDMDGSKGKVNSINAWGDKLYCFQDKGISMVMFNSRVQVPVSDGVPIEITNSYKVDGYRYLSDGIGCSNKWTIKETPYGIYFIDSVKNTLCRLSEGIDNLSEKLNTKEWFKDKGIDRVLYDDVHNDVYVVTSSESLCYSEALNNFTSRMSYKDLPLIESYNKNVFTLHGEKLWKMFTGLYNDFFGVFEDWGISFISNGADSGLMTMDKIFTNIDYRLDFFKGNDYDVYDGDITFNRLNVYNEYQFTEDSNGLYPLSEISNGDGLKTAKHYPGGNPQKKFRQWRIQIPREIKKMTNGLEVLYKRTNNRIRNPWCNISLWKRMVNTDDAKPGGGTYTENEAKAISDKKAILHDLSVQYYI